MFYFECCGDHGDLHSFPTRRSSDLEVPGAVQFEQWKDEWRAKLMPRIRDSLVKQMDDGRRIGDFETVERHAQLLLELDPLSEDGVRGVMEARAWVGDRRSEEHTSELQSRGHLVCRLLLEK